MSPRSSAATVAGVFDMSSSSIYWLRADRNRVTLKIGSHFFVKQGEIDDHALSVRVVLVVRVMRPGGFGGVRAAGVDG